MVEFITMAPTSGDGQYVGNSQGGTVSRLQGWSETTEREPSLAYISRIAEAAEKGGFGTLLLPTGSSCLDSLAIASALIPKTERLNFLFAVRPGFTAPAVFARQFATFDYLSGGRARVNIVTGGIPSELAADGDFLEHDARYRRTEEFITLLKRLFTEQNVNHKGEFYQLENATLFPKLVQQSPQIYFGGASRAGVVTAASIADVYMMWGETLDNTRERLEEVKREAALRGRTLSYSLSFQVVLGDTEEQAWNNAKKLISRIDPAVLEKKRQSFTKGDSVGVKRLHQLMLESKDRDFRIGPNLWAGLTQVLNGNSIALVGTPDQLADRLIEYIRLGFDKVLLRGFPHLETIEAIGRDIIPRVRARLAQQSKTAVGE